MLSKIARLDEVEDVYILRLKGDLDADAAHELREILEELSDVEEMYIVIDMTETRSIAPAISSEFIRCSRRLSERNKKLRMIGVPAETRQMLDVLNTEGNLLIFDGLTGALLSFPKTLRWRLNVHDRRGGEDRRWLKSTLLGRERRRADRRGSESEEAIFGMTVPA